MSPFFLPERLVWRPTNSTIFFISETKSETKYETKTKQRIKSVTISV